MTSEQVATSHKSRSAASPNKRQLPLHHGNHNEFKSKSASPVKRVPVAQPEPDAISIFQKSIGANRSRSSSPVKMEGGPPAPPPSVTVPLQASGNQEIKLKSAPTSNADAIGKRDLALKCGV